MRELEFSELIQMHNTLIGWRLMKLILFLPDEFNRNTSSSHSSAHLLFLYVETKLLNYLQNNHGIVTGVILELSFKQQYEKKKNIK